MYNFLKNKKLIVNHSYYIHILYINLHPASKRFPPTLFKFCIEKFSKKNQSFFIITIPSIFILNNLIYYYFLFSLLFFAKLLLLDQKTLVFKPIPQTPFPTPIFAPTFLMLPLFIHFVQTHNEKFC